MRSQFKNPKFLGTDNQYAGMYEKKPPSNPQEKALSLFAEEELILNEILSTNPDEITPINALQLISSWKNKLSGKNS